MLGKTERVAVGKADCLTGGITKFTLLLRTACLTGGEITSTLPPGCRCCWCLCELLLLL